MQICRGKPAGPAPPKTTSQPHLITTTTTVANLCQRTIHVSSFAENRTYGMNPLLFEWATKQHWNITRQASQWNIGAF
jgi:hypothetical protein